MDIKKFREENYHHQNVKVDLLLASLDLWDIVSETEDLLNIYANIKKKEDEKRRLLE